MAYRTLFVTNSACKLYNYGDGVRAVVEGYIQERKAMKVFTAPTKTEPRN